MSKGKGNGSPKTAVDLLIDLNDRVDETNERIDQTNARIDRLDSGLNARIETLDERLSTRIDLTNTHLAGISVILQDAAQRADQRHQQMMDKMQVLTTVLSSHITETGHSFAANNERLDALESRVDRLDALESRVDRLEKKAVGDD